MAEFWNPTRRPAYLATAPAQIVGLHRSPAATRDFRPWRFRGDAATDHTLKEVTMATAEWCWARHGDAGWISGGVGI